MTELLELASFPPLLVQFCTTALLSFIIGLELHSYRRDNQQDLGFGTTRTFTLIGVAFPAGSIQPLLCLLPGSDLCFQGKRAVVDGCIGRAVFEHGRDGCRRVSDYDACLLLTGPTTTCVTNSNTTTL